MAAISPWTNAGNTVNLIVLGTSDAASDASTPTYVENSPGYQSVNCTINGQDTTVPAFTMTRTKTITRTLFQALLNRYGANPNIGYVRFGLGRGGRTSPVTMTASGLSSLNQFDTHWENHVTEILNFEKSVQMSVLNSSGRVVQTLTTLNQFGTPPQYNVTQYEAQTAEQLDFGFGSQGLNQTDISNFSSNSMCTSDCCGNFEAYFGQMPLELQTIGPTDPTNSSSSQVGCTSQFASLCSQSTHADLRAVYSGSAGCIRLNQPILFIVQSSLPECITTDRQHSRLRHTPAVIYAFSVTVIY